MKDDSGSDGRDGNDNDTRPKVLHWQVPKRIKVQAVNFPGSKDKYGEAQVPYVKLRGMWLTRLRIDVGTVLTVIPGEDRLTLVVDKATNLKEC